MQSKFTALTTTTGHICCQPSQLAIITPTRQLLPFYIMYEFDIKMPSDFECANFLPANERQDPNMDIFRDRMKILRTEAQQCTGQM